MNFKVEIEYTDRHDGIKVKGKALVEVEADSKDSAAQEALNTASKKIPWEEVDNITVSGNEDLIAARKLLEWKPGFPKHCKLAYHDSYMGENAKNEVRRETNESPFFSEGYLYELLGKDEARALLGMMSRFFEAVGLDFDKIEMRKGG